MVHFCSAKEHTERFRDKLDTSVVSRTKKITIVIMMFFFVQCASSYSDETIPKIVIVWSLEILWISQLIDYMKNGGWLVIRFHTKERDRGRITTSGFSYRLHVTLVVTYPIDCVQCTWHWISPPLKLTRIGCSGLLHPTRNISAWDRSTFQLCLSPNSSGKCLKFVNRRMGINICENNSIHDYFWEST